MNLGRFPIPTTVFSIPRPPSIYAEAFRHSIPESRNNSWENSNSNSLPIFSFLCIRRLLLLIFLFLLFFFFVCLFHFLGVVGIGFWWELRNFQIWGSIAPSKIASRSISCRLNAIAAARYRYFLESASDFAFNLIFKFKFLRFCCI